MCHSQFRRCSCHWLECTTKLAWCRSLLVGGYAACLDGGGNGGSSGVRILMIEYGGAAGCGDNGNDAAPSLSHLSLLNISSLVASASKPTAAF